MPSFEYTAKDDDGKNVRGVVSAGAAAEVGRLIAAQGLHLIKCRPAAVRAASQRPFTTVELIEFTVQLQMLFEAGLPLTRALEVLEQDSLADLAAVIRDIRLRVMGGATFGDALGAHERVFPDVYIGMLKGGELAGTFDVSLREAVRFLETRETMKKALREATIYPVTVLIVSVAVIIVLSTFVFPKILGMIKGMNVPLSLPTKLVMGLSFVMRTIGPWAAAAAVLAGFGWTFARRRPAGRLRLDRLMLKLPLLGDIFLRLELARFAKAAGSMIASGVDLLRVISIAAATIQNRGVREEFHRAKLRIEAGLHLSDALAESAAMPRLFMTLLKVGETTGSLVMTFERTSAIYEREVQTRIKKVVAILQPAILGFLAVIVTTTALALFMTIQTVMQQATGVGARP